MDIFFTTAIAQKSTPVIPIFSGSKKFDAPRLNLRTSDREFLKRAVALFDAGELSAKVALLPFGTHPSVLLLGLGERKKWNVKKFILAMRRIVVTAAQERVKRVALTLEDFLPPARMEEAVALAATNLLMAEFDFNKYKTAPQGGWPKIESVAMLVKSPKQSGKFLQQGIILGEEVNNCRTLANTPAGDMTPETFAAHALSDAKRAKFKINILEEKEIARLKMGGIMGVSRGSEARPRFVIAEYWGGSRSAKPLVFVGKGVTFDSGGLNLKPSDAMYEMHMDMAGGAAVLHALSAISRAKLKINVVALIPAVENMPSGSSYRPGDILKTITGKTIEVLNTDAEGRIILADALGYAQRYKPELIIDAATLTGAAMVALGQRAIALFSSDEKVETFVRKASEMSGEPVWPLPLWDEYLEDVKGTFGDFANTGKNRYGGAIHGAIFLKQFVGDFPWAHLDIAPMTTSIEGDYLAKGASGAAVRLLFEVARHFSRTNGYAQ